MGKGDCGKGNGLASGRMTTTIDRSSVVPFYFQLKQLILADIKAHDRQPGDRLPGDHELCAAHDISRTVVRQALSELESEGVIERIKGKGTFVAQAKVPEGLVQSLTGLWEDVAARGSQLRSQVLRQEVVPADSKLAADLQISTGEPVILLERLRFVDGQPWALTITQLPQRLAPGLVHEDLTEQSLYALLEQSYGVRLVRGRRSVGATVASPELARSLGIAPGDAVLVLRSISLGVDERPVETFVAYHRADRSRFEVELTRSSAAQSAPLVYITE